MYQNWLNSRANQIRLDQIKHPFTLCSISSHPISSLYGPPFSLPFGPSLDSLSPPPPHLRLNAHTDPFADTGDSTNSSANNQAGGDSNSRSQTQQEKYIHIRVQQRNGRKTLTTVQGLPKGQCSEFRKRLSLSYESCNNGDERDLDL